MPGFEGFDRRTKVIHCDKPGTGSVDTPRCFSLKLKQSADKIGMKSCSVDPELCIMHKSIASAWSGKTFDNLVALMTRNVDDLKVCGMKDVSSHENIVAS